MLIATDDGALARTTSQALKQASFEVAATHADDELPQVVRSDPPDLLILDAASSGKDALALCRRLREDPATAHVALIVVADGESRAAVADALDAGADDSVARPPNPQELLARVRAFRRRPPQTVTRDGRLLAGAIDMDLDRWTVTVDGQLVELTKKEFRLLQMLLEARGRVLSRDLLLANVWAHGATHGLDTRTVDVHVGRLRRKLGDSGRHILTVRNVGFRFEIVPDWITTKG